MNKELFLSLLENYMNSLGAINAMHGIGFDITAENDTFPIESFVDEMFDATMRLILTEEGADLIFAELFAKPIEEDVDFESLYELVKDHVQSN